MPEPNRVFVLQGAQGSGKSTFARNFPHAVICSADDFFVGADGVYRQVAADLKQAHAACLRKFVVAVQIGIAPLLIVDNTNAQRWEMGPYVQLARAYGYEVEIHTFLIDPRVAFERNLHNVPWENILRTTLFMESPLGTWGRHTVHLPDGTSWSSKLDDPAPVDNE
jgi:predicted kinase